MRETRLQNDYNEAVCSCDIFMSLFKTKTGKFTEEEFSVAHQSFKASGRPFIYTYFMETEVSNHRSMREPLASLWSFQEKFSELGHYPTTYKNIADLKL